MIRFTLNTAALLFFTIAANAQSGPKSSDCLAIAQNLLRVQFASFSPSQAKSDEAKITFVGHSTFIIETPAGIKIATDFSGFAAGQTPDVVTMNRAHSSHYTNSPDPAIQHVLRGWSDDPTKPAEHNLAVEDVRIRNVTTDIRNGENGRVKDGNSIFVFEVAGLCIGHLGHLHHELTPSHIAWIGRLDVVMVAVDGGLTMPVENVMTVLKDIRARVVLPMHARFAGSLERFLNAARTEKFDVKYLSEPTMNVSPNTLPEQTTVIVMPGN